MLHSLLKEKLAYKRTAPLYPHLTVGISDVGIHVAVVGLLGVCQKYSLVRIMNKAVRLGNSALRISLGKSRLANILNNRLYLQLYLFNFRHINLHSVAVR